MQTDVVTEILEAIHRAGEEDVGEDVESRIQHLPRTNPDFEASKLYGIVSGQLQAQLGEAVNEAVDSQELQFAHGDCVSSGAVDEVVARLVASPSFAGVVLGARACLQRTARLKNAACDLPGAGATAAVRGGNTTKDERIHFHRNDMSSSDTEGEGMHAKKKALRMDDWVGTFSLSGGGAGRGFSPRIDVEAALGQLEAGLGSPAGSATSAIEALGLLAEADPELFQFGNHWPPFLELARRALRSADPAVHAKALSLHWVMYEKSMGMSAADMCEGVLDHARHYFASTVHVLPFPAPKRQTAPSARDGGDGDTGVRLAGLENPELARAAREARALHGMLATIHEAFQHLPEKRVWNIVSGFLSLFGDAAAAAAAACATGPLAENGGDAATTVANSDISSVPLGVDVDSGGGSGGSPQVVLLPAHFLAIAGRVDDWLPGWLRALSTGRLVRAVNDAGLVATMVRRCAALQPQVPFLPRRLNRPRRAEPAFGATTTDLGNRAAAFRPSLSAAAAAVVPPGDVVAPPLTYLDRALLLQSVSFLGTMAAHCRGNPRPCPPPGDAVAAAGLPAAANGNVPPGGAGGEGGLVVDLEREDKQQGEVMQALAQCAAREAPPAAEPAGGRVAPRQSYCSRRATPISVRCVALGYVGQVARAVAGTTSTPFTPTVIDVLFSPLAGGSGHWNGSGRSGGQAGNSGGGSGGGNGVSFRHSRFNREENGGPPPPPSVGVKEEEEEEPASFFGALAEIAGVLLSSRGSSTGFFVDGPAGPEASCALLEIARCTAELAKYACWRYRSSNGRFSGSGSGSGGGSGGGALGKEKGDGTPVVLGSADAWESRFRWLGRGDAERLAVEFACALAPIMGYPPKQRVAGWAALWRCDVPYALAALTTCLDNSPAPKGSASGKVDGGQRNINRSSASASLEGRGSGDGDERRSGGRGGDGGSSGDEPWKRDCDLRDRLLLSLVEWARDLAGVSYLRKVGLAGPCASFLSRYLARRNLRPACRDECADPRPLALAARLSLCAEGLEGLLCADGGIADEMDAGLGRLEELMDLAELLPSQAAAGLPLPRLTPPSHALALAVGGTNIGFRGGGEGRGVDDSRVCSSASDHQRFSGMEVGGGGGAPDLRCLDFARRFSCLSTALSRSGSAVDSVGAAAVRADRWLRWAVSRAAPGGPLPDAGGLAPEEEVAHVPEDVHVAALGLATSLASDLTVAVAMEARWSLADALARQQPVDGVAGVAAVSSGSDAGIDDGGGNTRRESGRNGGEEGDPEAIVSESGSGSNQERSGSRGGGRGGVMAAHIPDVLVPVEPAGLGCARLVVSLTSLGGPTEERRNRLRRLRDAEALAGAPSACLRGDAVAAATAAASAAATATVTVAATAAAAADAPDADDVRVTSQHVRGDLRGMAQITHFPEDGLSDEDWWSAARQCVSTVVAVLAKPRGPRTGEAFALLARAAAKGPALPPGPAAAAAHAPGFTAANNRDGGTLRVPGSESDLPGERPAVTAVAAATMAAMTKLLFSYARGLGLVDGSDRDRFGAGLRSTLAVAESVKSATTSPFFMFPFLSAYSAAGPAGKETRFDGRSCGCDWFMAVVFLTSGGADGAAASEMILSASRRRFPGASLAPPSLHAADEAGSRAAELAAETSAAAASLAAAAVAGVAAHGSADRAADVPVVGTPQAPRLPPVSMVSTTTARFLPAMTVSESCAAGKEDEEEAEVAAGVVTGAGASAGARAGVGVTAGASPSLLYVGAAAAARASLGDPPLLLLAALAEEVVEEELPGVSGALRAAGWAVAPLAVRWMRQCMLCVVDWPGVVAYLTLTLLRGHDYQVYFVVALLRTAQPSIMDAVSAGLYLHLGDLLPGGESALDGFDLADALSYMEGLERRHRPRCLAATEAYFAR